MQQRLNKGEASFDVKVAAPAEANMQLTATAAGDAAVQAVVVATVGPRRAAQTLRFTREGQRWKLSGVQLQ